MRVVVIWRRRHWDKKSVCFLSRRSTSPVDILTTRSMYALSRESEFDKKMIVRKILVYIHMAHVSHMSLTYILMYTPIYISGLSNIWHNYLLQNHVEGDALLKSKVDVVYTYLYLYANISTRGHLQSPFFWRTGPSSKKLTSAWKKFVSVFWLLMSVVLKV
jgi:hypothetical protein